MKKITSELIEKLISYLSCLLDKMKNEKVNFNHFHSLSPTDDAENVENYLESINWALANREKIKNIAISGAYGSGKSSVIQTFIKRNKNSDYKFLNISLATFKEIREKGKSSRDSYGNNGRNDMLRLIELSVLQQLFYHEEDCKIPDSRFKKIKSYKSRSLLVYSIALIVVLISILYLVVPEFLAKFSIVNIPNFLIRTTQIIASLITLVGIFFLIYRSSRAIKGATIKKLNVSNAEIEIDAKISKSILNNHIDEILYFFEVTDYNVVIIEDLDRFEQTEVFTKLREINLLINNSEKIKEDVVFIYAIKDDMFVDKDRTKFFDFMIPIIPVINTSNSSQKLLGIVKKNKYKISDDLMDDLSLFIDDMRLLYNIMNEYHIYSQNLDRKLDQNKLLSMVVYKNIYPSDFGNLSLNKGVLYETMLKKSDFINEKIIKLDNQISTIKNNIEEAEKIKIRDLKELRLIYISKIIQLVNSSGHAFKQFWINGKGYNLQEVTENILFNCLSVILPVICSYGNS